MTLILTTVLFILGFFAVGPERSLSNPHHGIGVAIYVLIIAQVFGGSLVHRQEKRKGRLYISLKLMLHQWFGRVIALLGIIQIPLGLTLYGSPQHLFVLYTIAAALLLLTYFIFSWLHQRRINHDYDRRGTYRPDRDEVIDERTDDRRSGLGKLAAAGIGAAGLAALLGRRSSRNRREDEDVVGTESGTSYMTNEKYSDRPGKGWKSKLLTVGAVVGGIAAVKALFGGRRDDSSDIEPHRPPLGGNQSFITESYIEEGRPPRPVTPPGASPGYVRPSHPLAQPPMTPSHRHSASSLTYSYYSGSPSRRDRRHTFRSAAATGGALFALRQMFKGRRQRKEDRRLEEERIHRADAHGQYTGDGSPPRRHRPYRTGSQISTEFSGSMINDPQSGDPTGPILGGVGAASAAALANRNRIRPPGTDPPVIAGPGNMPTNIPPIPPIHRTDVDSSGSEAYSTISGHRPHSRHHRRGEAAAGAAFGAAVTEGAAGSRRRHSGRTQNTDSMESPPVSLKVKMHNDGRHVTLRRLTEEEAAAQREERRRLKRASVPAAATAGGAAGIANSGRRRRNSSFSSSSGGEGPSARLSSADRRWRRTEALERQQAEAMAAQTAAPAAPLPGSAYQPPVTPQPPAHYATTVDPTTGQPLNVPPPPPIPGGSGLGPPASVTSPGTETSGATEYANNRRRRRAERAQAEMARRGRMGGEQKVEFS